jgi:iron complex outermembrane receptor protein
MKSRAFGTAASHRAAIGLLLLGGALFDTAPAMADPDTGQTGIETITVTATKRPELLQETPISITAFTADDLKTHNIQNLSDIAPFTPNLVFDRGTGDTGSSETAQIFIRGIGQSDFLFTTDPGVGIYLDGVYLPTSIGALMDLNDVDQIEVLKGPQGTLFGQNTIGGAINITTKAPTPDFGGSATVELGNYSARNFLGTVNLPLVKDTLLASLSFASENEDGYMKRPSDNSTEGDIDSQVVRGQLLWMPTADFSLRLIGDYTQAREHAIPEVELAVNTSATLLAGWNFYVGGPEGKPYTAASISPNVNEDNGTGPNFSDLTVGGAAGIATWQLGSVTLKSISSYRFQGTQFGIDSDHSDSDYVTQTVFDDQEQLSEEVQLLGAAFGDRLNYVLGATYFHLAGHDSYNLDLAPGLYPIIGLDLNELIDTHLDSSSYSGYVHADYKITDQLSISAGLRYTYVSKDLGESLQLLASGVTAFNVAPSDNWNATTPQAGIQYQWTPNIMTYVSAARGFKAGGFNGRASDGFVAETPFSSEYVWTYEAGAKTEWFDKHLLIDGAAFYSNYTNMQLLTVLADPSSPGSVAAVVQNAGRARIDGFELQSTVIPVDNLQLDLGLGYLDSAYTELASGVSGITLQSKLPKAPKWTMTAGGDYNWRVPTGSLDLRADLSYRSTEQEVANNSPLLVQPGYWLLTANLRYQLTGAPWSIALYGNNLTDTRYMTNGLDALSSVGIAGATYGRPREYGVRIDYNF